MKKNIIIILLIFLTNIFFVPKYNELNNLAIIDNIGVSFKEDNYTIYLREIIPTKDNNKMHYEYKIYDVTTNNLDIALHLLQTKTKKQLYLKKVKSLIINTESDKITSKLKIKPKVIYHTNNILKTLKKS